MTLKLATLRSSKPDGELVLESRDPHATISRFRDIRTDLAGRPRRMVKGTTVAGDALPYSGRGHGRSIGTVRPNRSPAPPLPGVRSTNGATAK